MSDFQGMEDMLNDFLTEAGELLSKVDNQLVELEKHPGDVKLLNEIFRGFHTIKGGAGFLNAATLVELCHLTENLFDQLRNGALRLTPEIMDAIMESTAMVRTMFDVLAKAQQPPAAGRELLDRLQAALSGKPLAVPAEVIPLRQPLHQACEPDWQALHHALLDTRAAPAETPRPQGNPGRRASDNPEADVVPVGRRETDKVAVSRETTIRVDTHRLDQVLNLSGEIGLTKNRLACLRHDLLSGKRDGETMRAFDEAVNQLDLLVGDLQNSVMKTRMHPIGRLFQKYPRMARDLARSLGKTVELAISGEETELDRSMIDDLADPLVHLVRNAVDHGVESTEDRRAAGKPETSVVRLSARQAGDHILIEISDDGRGMRADVLRQKAVEKGLIDADTANGLDERQSLQLVFLPGFSTKDQISSVSGRGVGMDVVKNNIQKLNGRIEIESVPGNGTTFRIALETAQIRPVGGRATMVVRDDVLPVRTLATLLGREQQGYPRFGVLMQSALGAFILAVDGYVGREDVVIKPLEDVKPRGIAGATLSGSGSVVLVLDMQQLFDATPGIHDERMLTAAAA
jgi:two-component system, chemotaxis family, sensor kinase CheA